MWHIHNWKKYLNILLFNVFRKFCLTSLLHPSFNREDIFWKLATNYVSICFEINFPFCTFIQNQDELDKIFKKIKIYMIWYINQNHVIMLITWHWPQLCWCKSGGKRWPRFNWSAAEQALLEVKRCSKKNWKRIGQ